MRLAQSRADAVRVIASAIAGEVIDAYYDTFCPFHAFWPWSEPLLLHLLGHFQSVSGDIALKLRCQMETPAWRFLLQPYLCVFSSSSSSSRIKTWIPLSWWLLTYSTSPNLNTVGPSPKNLMNAVGDIRQFLQICFWLPINSSGLLFLSPSWMCRKASMQFRWQSQSAILTRSVSWRKPTTPCFCLLRLGMSPQWWRRWGLLLVIPLSIFSFIGSPLDWLHPNHKFIHLFFYSNGCLLLVYCRL